MPEKKRSFFNIICILDIFKLGTKQNNNSSSNLDENYKEAILLFKSKEIDKAQIKFEDILNKSPEHHGSTFNLAKIYLYKNKNKEANNLFKKYLDFNPNSFEAKIKLAESFVKIDEFESAIGILNQLKNIELEVSEKEIVNTSLIQSYNFQAKYFRNKKDYKNSISCLDQVYKFDKDKEKFLFNQAMCLKDWGKYDRAKEVLNEIIDLENSSKSKYLIDSYYQLGQIEEINNIRRAILIYNRFIKANPQNDLVHFFAGKINFLNKDYDSAIENYLKSMKKNKFLNEVHLNIALSYMFQKNYTKAIEFFEKVLNKDTSTLSNLVICKLQTGDVVKAFDILNKISEKDFEDNPHSAKSIGLALLELGILEKAYEELKIAQKFLPNDQEISVSIAKYYKKMGDTEKYNHEIQKALKDHPNNISVLNELSNIYKENNQDKKVIETFEKILLLDPKNKEPLRLMAEFYQNRRNFKLAVVKYTEYLSFIKSDIESIYNLALCYFENIQINQAINELKKIESHVFHGLTACSLLSDIYISKGDTENALKYIQKCFEFSPSYIDGYLKYAKICVQSGKTVQALEYLRYAEKIDPNNKDVQHFIKYYSSAK